MATLYNQAIAHRFGVELVESLESGEWNQFHFAVAWARRTGIRHLEPALRSFLRNGGVIRGIVGIDLEHTSHEGLQELLSISADGDAEIVVYHNEAQVTFHPKLYLLTSNNSARLIVGSNNLTEAGLYTNTEAGLQIDTILADPVIVDALSALQSWSNVGSLLARRLDAALLGELLSEGYVVAEASIHRRIAETKRAASPSGRARRKLFGNRAVTAPTPPSGSVRSQPAGTTAARRSRRRVPGGTRSNTVGNVLLMRVRRASETGRRTQIQLPVRKLANFFGSNFFDGVARVTSAHDGRAHDIREASARGGRNTTKLEVPEIDTMADPVMRFERTPTGITYEAYDRTTAQGQQIINALEDGRRATPPTTMMTVGDAARATMARHI